MNGIIFVVQEPPEGGFAEALGYPIFTVAENLES